MQDFILWYENYPRKVAKAKARNAYIKARKSVNASFLEQKLKEQVMLWKKQDVEMRFIPYPATWLNSERYLDEYLDDNIRLREAIEEIEEIEQIKKEERELRAILGLSLEDRNLSIKLIRSDVALLKDKTSDEEQLLHVPYLTKEQREKKLREAQEKQAQNQETAQEDEEKRKKKREILNRP